MKATFIDIGNLNNVYKLEIESNTYFMKHYGDIRKSTPGIKSIGDLGDRCQRERDAINFYREHLNPINFPKIVHEGKDLTVFTSVGEDSLLNILLGDFDEDKMCDFQYKFADMLRELHKYKVDFNDDKLDERFYKFRTASNLKQATGLYDKSKFCVINGDLNPRQIFINNDNFGLCDFEFTGMGLPGYDVGFYLANLHIINHTKGGLKKVIDSFEYKPEYTDFFIGTSILNRIEGVPVEPWIKTDGLKELADKFIGGRK